MAIVGFVSPRDVAVTLDNPEEVVEAVDAAVAGVLENVPVDCCLAPKLEPSVSENADVPVGAASAVNAESALGVRLNVESDEGEAFATDAGMATGQKLQRLLP
jgi:hypothetical protein